MKTTLKVLTVISGLILGLIASYFVTQVTFPQLVSCIAVLVLITEFFRRDFARYCGICFISICLGTSLGVTFTLPVPVLLSICGLVLVAIMVYFLFESKNKCNEYRENIGNNTEEDDEILEHEEDDDEDIEIDQDDVQEDEQEEKFSEDTEELLKSVDRVLGKQSYNKD